MLRKLAGFILLLLLLGVGGCVVYDPYPGYYDYPQYHPRYRYWGPPMEFRYHHYRGWHDGLNQEDAVKSPFRLGYQDRFMCVDPKSLTLPTG